MKRMCMLTVIMMIILCGCGREQVSGLEDKGVTRVSAEDVSAIAGDSENDTREIPTTIDNIGGQLLKIAYDEYRGKGLSEKDISRLSASPFRDNLGKLYRDLESAIE